MHKKLLTIATALCLAALLTGCGIPAKINGGGSIVGEDGKTASFGFHAEDCTPASEDLNTWFNGTGQLNYNDKGEGVKFHAEVKEANQCLYGELGSDVGLACLYCAYALSGGDPEYFDYALQHLADYGYKGIGLSYKSTNPKNPGEGLAGVCTADFGEGNPNDGLHGFTFVSILDGPYANYFNAGPVQGNIQMLPCTAEDGIPN